MTGDELLAALADAGLTPVWQDGKVLLQGDSAAFTPALKNVMRLHREWLEERVRPKPPPPKPLILYWRSASRLVLLTSPPMDDVPYRADGWSPAPLMPGKDEGWRALEELPPEWGFAKWWE